MIANSGNLPCNEMKNFGKLTLNLNIWKTLDYVSRENIILAGENVTIERSVQKLIPSCQNCQPENTHNACKQIITFSFAAKTHLKINAQKRYLHQNQSFGPLSFIGRRISSFRRLVWPQFIIFHRRISPTKWKVQRCPPSWDWPGFALRMRTAKSGSGGRVKSQSNVLRL